jgi:uncharacterized Zn finger protein (UPF0148 family)
MFKDVIRELHRMEEGMRVSIQLKLDDDGYLDRKCPSKECNVDFKVHFEDWRNKVADEVVYCPICRYQAASTEWNTQAQNQQIKTEAERYVHDRLGKAISTNTRRFNRSQPRDNFIKLSMSYRPGLLPVVIPAAANEILRQQYTCEKCASRYSSLGAAFFCPACGHNSAIAMLDASVRTVQKTLENLQEIRETLTKGRDPDTAEDTVRQLCENGLVKLLSSFQCFAEALFDRIPNRAAFNPRRNLFQNLQESDHLWRLAIGGGYADMLSASEYSALVIFFQQRHILAHKEGIVDQDYLDRSGDQRYALGQRLVIRGEAVTHLADLILHLADELRKRL